MDNVNFQSRKNGLIHHMLHYLKEKRLLVLTSWERLATVDTTNSIAVTTLCCMQVDFGLFQSLVTAVTNKEHHRIRNLGG